MQNKLVLTAFIGILALHGSTGEETVRTSANKAAQLMEKSMSVVAPNVPCASCHHNMLPLWALSVARDHGVTINAEMNRRIAVKTYSFLQDVDRAIQGSSFVDPAMEGAELLALAKDAGVKPSVTTALHARRLATLQRDDGHWVTLDARPPQSSSCFKTTALNIKVLSDYMPPQLRKERDSRIAHARQWLLETYPASVDDGAYRLLGLSWSDASAQEQKAAAKILLDWQRADGGWGQFAGRAADAYATGEALTALKLTGTIADGDYARGVQWLLANQREDGSWLVKTRIHDVAPISPPYMETGFPHGRDQIVSMVGSTWAMLALSLGLPENRQPQTELSEARPTAPDWIETAAFGEVKDLKALDKTLRTAGGSTLLMTVANDPLKVQALIDGGANVNERAKSGHTALMTAATYQGAAPVIRRLISRGADAKPRPDTQFNANPLIYATFAGDLESVRILLEHGADFTQVTLLEGMVPMHPVSAAVMLDEAEILKEYLKRGVDPNMVDGLPILSRAALMNRAAAVKALLDAGADPNRRDKFGWTPVRHAGAIEHDVPSTEVLIQRTLKKVDLSQRN